MPSPESAAAINCVMEPVADEALPDGTALLFGDVARSVAHPPAVFRRGEVKAAVRRDDRAIGVRAGSDPDSKPLRSLCSSFWSALRA